MINIDSKLASIEADKARKHAFYLAHKDQYNAVRKAKREALVGPPKPRTRRTPEETRAAQREWYKQHAEVMKEKARLHRLTLSKEKKREYQIKGKKAYRIKRDLKMAEIAGRPRAERCELCGGVGSGRSKESKTVFDHNHNTGEFRGWLCNRCNVIAGLAEDNPEILRVIATYLENDGIISVH